MKKSYLTLLLTGAMFFWLPKVYCQLGIHNIKICVISDMHYFDSTLLVNDGPAFQAYLNQDPKLLKESHSITVSVIDSLISENPNLVLVTGDLTKDGENIDHLRVAEFFQQLENAGIQVIVIPGNHDINNPDAKQFDNDTTYPVPSITPAEFKSIYHNYGYDLAILNDTTSLSYLTEPIPGLQILALDINRYDSNYANGIPVISGGFKPHLLQWTKDRITEAKQAGKVLICMEHHNLLEHFQGQKTLFPEYVIDDYDTISSQLANLGLKLMLTGHFHAQDIVEKTTSLGHTVFDVETASLVCWPCPYRIFNIDTDTILHITGKRVESVNYNTDTMTFQEYALYSLKSRLPLQIINMLRQPPLSADSAIAAYAEPAITETIIAHFGGNEGTPTPATRAIINIMMSFYPSYGNILNGIYTDLAPDDWTVDIDLGYTAPTGTNDMVNINDIRLFPNPSNGKYNLFLPEIKDNVRICVYDITGKLIYQKYSKGNQLMPVDISGNAPGQYLISLDISHTKLTKKIILQ